MPTKRLTLALELVASGQDRSLPLAQRSFVYMPNMHSECALVHTQAALLFAQPGLEDTLRFEQRHQAIIERLAATPTATPSWAASPRPRSWLF